MSDLDQEARDRLLKSSLDRRRWRLTGLFFVTYVPVGLVASTFKRMALDDLSFAADVAFGMFVTLPVVFAIYIPLAVGVIRRDLRSHIAIHGVDDNGGDT